MRGDALHIIKNISGPNWKTLEEFLTVYRRTYGTPESMVKHKVQRIDFDPANRVVVQAFIELIFYGKALPHLVKSKNKAQLENGFYEKIVSRLERGLEFNGLEATDELQTNTVTQYTTKPYPEIPMPKFDHCKNPSFYRTQCSQLRRGKNETESNKKSAGKNRETSKSGQTNCNPNKNIPIKATSKTQTTKMTENKELSTHLAGPAAKLTAPQLNAILEPMNQIGLLLGTENRRDRIRISDRIHGTKQMKKSRLRPKPHTKKITSTLPKCT